MSRFIAFLRAINVGGARTVKMDTLRQLFESLGFSEVATFIASGNVVFETTGKNSRALERKIEARLQEALGYEVATFIRTDSELMQIAEFKPFPQSEIGADINIIFLAEPLDDQLRQKVTALSTDTDEFRVHGREIYWLRRPTHQYTQPARLPRSVLMRRRKPGQSLYSTVPLAKTLGRPFTVRGASTVKKMAMKHC